MTQYFSPGVYIEEVESGPVPIQGVPTSITGAVGVTVKGPTSGKPILVTSFNDFQNTFGGFLTPPSDSQKNQWLDPVDGGAWWQFPLSVKGYFENGGQQLYVKRVFSSTAAQAASGSLGQGLIADLAATTAITDTTLQLAHLFGISKSGSSGAGVQILVNGTAIATGGTPTNFPVAWYDPSSRKIGVNPAPGVALKPGRDLVVIETLNPPTSTNNVTLKFSAKAKGAWGNSLYVRVTPALGATLSLLPDTVNGGTVFSGTVASATTVFLIAVPASTAIAAGQTVIINNQIYQVGTVTAGSTTAPVTPTTFTVAAGVADGLQNLSGGGPVVIVPTTAGSPNVIVTSSSIGAVGTFTVAVPQATAIAGGQTVIINGRHYTVGTVTAGTPAGTGGSPPATPTTFTIAASVADGLQSLVAGAAVIIVPASGANVTVASLSITLAPIPVTVTLNTTLPTGVNNEVFVQGRLFAIATLTTSAGASQFTLALTYDRLSDAAWPANVPISTARKARATTVKAINDTFDIKDASQLYLNALVEFDNGSAKEFANVVAINDVSVTFNPAPSNRYYEGQKVRVLEASVGTIQYASDGTISAQESFTNLRLSYDQSTDYLVNYVNQFSVLVNVAVNPAGLWTDTTAKIFNNPAMFPASATGGWLQLADGDDALGALTVDDFVGTDGGPGNRTGIQALEDIDDVSICVVPGMWSTTVQSALIAFCESLADRVAILDPPDGLDIAGIQAFRAPYDSKYAALYYPWLVVRDLSLQQNVTLAPSGHMAGIYAQTDAARGVFKAPANVTVAGITLSGPPNTPVGFAQNINQREQDVLNPIGINALRYFPNRGYRVWGARTLSSDTLWKYINVRRIFIYIEKSIQVGTQWVVFEPNDEGTWSRVRQSVTNFLTTFWRQGGLQGATAKDAFFVACDLGVTMTQDDIDNGRMIVQIGIAPVKPAEFVIFQIQQYTQTAATS